MAERLIPSDIDLCISALHALKVGREAYASSLPYTQLKIAVCDALYTRDSPLTKAVAEAIRAKG